MYFEVAKWGKNSFPRYLVGFLITAFGYAVLGSLPLLIVIMTSADGMSAIDGSSIDPTKLSRIAGSKNAAFLLLTTIFVITMFCFWFVVHVIHEKRMKWIATGAKDFRWNMFWFAFFIGALAIISGLVISYFTSPGELNFRFNARSFGILVLIAVVMIPIQAGWEELFFRGYLMQGLGLMKIKSYVFFAIAAIASLLFYNQFKHLDLLGVKELVGFSPTIILSVLALTVFIFRLLTSVFEKMVETDNQGFMNKNWALLPLLVTTLLFAAVHMANPEVAEHGVKVMFPIYATLGLSFGLMVLLSDGLELAMGFHIANNLWLSLLMSSPESVLQTDSLFYTTEVQDLSGEIWSVLLMNAIILGIFAWRYGWIKNWKKRLFGPIA